MIDIGITRNKGRIEECTIEGHADYDEYGYDIVCAAISAISCTAILGLQELVHDEGQFENKPGYCLIRPAKVNDERVQAILETMVLGCTEISRQYKTFVKVTNK